MLATRATLAMTRTDRAGSERKPLEPHMPPTLDNQPALYHRVVSTRFGRSELLRPLGAGGMAEVFLARYVGPEGFEKRLVIKRVLPRLSDDRHLLRMFFEEAKTHVSLSHGNLVSVFDFGRVGNDYFIAMEHVHGADLGTLLAAESAAGRTLAPPLCAYIGIDLC